MKLRILAVSSKKTEILSEARKNGNKNGKTNHCLFAFHVTAVYQYWVMAAGVAILDFGGSHHFQNLILIASANSLPMKTGLETEI